MCELCGGTHVIHEIGSFYVRTTYCPICGPEPEDIWNARINRLLAWAETMEKKKTVGGSNG